MLGNEEKVYCEFWKQAFRQVWNVREVMAKCLGFVTPVHVAQPMKENISCISTDYVFFSFSFVKL